MPRVRSPSDIDITTVLVLAGTIRQSLSQIASTATEVQTLLDDIDTFTHALQQIKSDLAACALVPFSLRNGVGHALELAFQLLKRVNERIKSLNTQVAVAAGRQRSRDVSATLLLSTLGGSAEVVAMRARLVDYVAVCQTLLAAHRQNEVKDHAEPHDYKTADMFASMLELCQQLSQTSQTSQSRFTELIVDVHGAQIPSLYVLPFFKAWDMALLDPLVWTETDFVQADPQSNPITTLSYSRVSISLDHSLAETIYTPLERPLLGDSDERLRGFAHYQLICAVYDEGCKSRSEFPGALVYIWPVYLVIPGSNGVFSVLAPDMTRKLSELVRTSVPGGRQSVADLFCSNRRDD